MVLESINNMLAIIISLLRYFHSGSSAVVLKILVNIWNHSFFLYSCIGLEALFMGYSFKSRVFRLIPWRAKGNSKMPADQINTIFLSFYIDQKPTVNECLMLVGWWGRLNPQATRPLENSVLKKERYVSFVRFVFGYFQSSMPLAWIQVPKT